MSKKILKCPYCGSTRANRTGLGWAESAAKGIGAFGVGLVVASFNHEAGHKTTENIIEGNSSEYKCKSCGKTFRHSDKKGSYR